MQSVVVAEEDEVTAAVAAVVVVAEEAAETEVAETVVAARQQPQVVSPASIRAPSTQIFRQAIGQDASYIINGGGGHISVLSLPPAPGRIFILLSNEPVTSPRRVHQQV